jgi:hypothetical protein
MRARREASHFIAGEEKVPEWPTRSSAFQNRSGSNAAIASRYSTCKTNRYFYCDRERLFRIP